MNDAQRFNYFPATPLPMISWFFQGDLHMVEEPSLTSAAPFLMPALARVVISGPQRKPTASWSPGAVHALSVCFYPEALSSVLGINVGSLVDKIVPLQEVVCEPLLAPLLNVGTQDAHESFRQVQAVLQPLWQGMSGVAGLPTMRGWVRSMVVRAAFTKSGAGVRRAQRRFKAWTGQNYRDLQLYVRAERAMAYACAQPQEASWDLASLAADAGFADQSHLGREVRRITGISPGRLSELMRSEEAFWCYRLMSEHWQRPSASRLD